MAETLASAIELLGHRVRKAPNGWRGLEIARDWLPETVMCDIGLEGELDGYSVARTLRAERGGELQLIAITGYGRDEDRRRSTAAGFDRHVTKPVSLDVLGEVLGASSD